MGTDANRVFEREANERDVRGDGFRVHEQSFVVVVGKSKYWGGGVVLGIDLSLRRDGRRIRFALKQLIVGESETFEEEQTDEVVLIVGHNRGWKKR